MLEMHDSFLNNMYFNIAKNSSPLKAFAEKILHIYTIPLKLIIHPTNNIVFLIQ